MGSEDQKVAGTVRDPTSSTPLAQSRFPVAIPRGELWFSADVFEKASLVDDLSGHLTLVQRLGQHLLCLPISEEASLRGPAGYRYFSVSELKRAIEMSELFNVAVIDGPFQKLIQRVGLYQVMRQWRQKKTEIAGEYLEECNRVHRLLLSILEHRVDAVVIADDLAGETSTFVSLQDIRELFFPFYREATVKIHGVDAVALFHSCGRIETMIPELLLWGFDGFAALQDRLNHLDKLMRRHGSRIIVLGGIEPELLEPKPLSPRSLEKYKTLLGSLSAYDGFVLSSCCGLSTGDSSERIGELYRIADQMVSIDESS